MYILKSGNDETILQKEKLIHILLSHPHNSGSSVFDRYWYSSRVPTLDYKVYHDDYLVMDFSKNIPFTEHYHLFSTCIKYKSYRDAIHALNDAIGHASAYNTCTPEGIILSSTTEKATEGLLEGLNNSVVLLRSEIKRVLDSCV